MSNVLKIAAAGGVTEETDEFFENTVLLLHGDGNQGATNFSNTGSPSYLAFKDNSTNNFPITVNGDAYGDNFGPYVLPEGNWSNFFDGSGDYLTFATSSAFATGTNDFCVEFWAFRPTGSTASGVFSTYVGNTGVGIAVGFNSTNNLIFNIGNDGSTANGDRVTSASVVPVNQWFHVAAIRSGSNMRMYINGVSEGTGTTSRSVDRTLCIAGLYYTNNTTFPYSGYVSNLRFVTNATVYDASQSTITVPTAPLTAITGTQLLTCQSNRFVDNSTNNFAITRNGDVKVQVFNPFGVLPDGVNGSGFFDGSGDNITAPSNAAFGFGTGDATVEMWIYPSIVSGTQVFFDTRNGGTGIGFYLSGATLSVAKDNTTVLMQGGTVVANAWNYVAWSRNGSTNRLFLNGALTATVTDSTNYPTNPASIGSYFSTAYFSGYVSNTRVIKGTAVYTAAFTPPTAPLTAVTNTQLLTCQYAGSVRNVGFIDSGPYDFPITRVGNTTQGTFSPFSKPDGRWSNFFGSSSANLKFASNAAFAIGTGNFTVECFVNFTEWAGTFQRIFIQGVSGTTNVSLGRESGGTALNVDINTSNVISYTWTPVLGRWYHIAVVRTGTGSGQVALYIDGVSVATGTSSASVGQNQFIVGGLDWASGYNVRGYISNLRYSNIARTITVPTAPYSSDGNTLILTCQSNRFIDNSSNAFAITRNGDVKVTPFSPFPITTAYDPAVNGGAGYFDGSGDHLVTPSNAAFTLSGDFTISAWVYRTVAGVNGGIFTTAPSTTDVGVALVVTSGNVLSLRFGPDSTVVAISDPNTFPLNQWVYVGATRSGNDITLYLNGVAVATGTTTKTPTTTTGYIGRFYTNVDNFYLTGYIADLKVVKGTATALTSIPTAPATNTSGTSLLLNYTNAGILDNTGFNALETVGNAQIDTSVKKYGTGAMKFDGTGDWLLLPSNPDLAVGTGDFTIEFWANWNAVSASTPGNVAHGVSNGSLGVFIVNSKIELAQYNVGADLQVNVTQTTGSWDHYAITRQSGTARIFKNGVLLTSGTVNTNYGQNGFQIGAGIGSTVNGYIDDLRITKGIARYTTTFTPPDKSLPDIGE